MSLLVGAPHDKSPLCQFGDHMQYDNGDIFEWLKICYVVAMHCGNGDIMVLICQAIWQDHVQGIMWLYRWKLLKLSHSSAKYGSHRQCKNGGIIFNKTTHAFA